MPDMPENTMSDAGTPGGGSIGKGELRTTTDPRTGFIRGDKLPPTEVQFSNIDGCQHGLQRYLRLDIARSEHASVESGFAAGHESRLV